MNQLLKKIHNVFFINYDDIKNLLNFINKYYKFFLKILFKFSLNNINNFYMSLSQQKIDIIVIFRNENTNYRENLWNERSNFVALGVGMRSKTEQPVVWQIIPSQNQVKF